MSYLDDKPTFTRTTGSNLENWLILFELSPKFAQTLPAGLGGFIQIGSLDAVTLLNAGGMTSTAVMGSPIPLFIEREPRS